MRKVLIFLNVLFFMLIVIPGAFADDSQLIKGNINFAIKLMNEVRNHEFDNNVIFSPIGLGQSLSVLSNGAVGHTFDELNLIQGFDGYNESDINYFWKNTVSPTPYTYDKKMFVFTRSSLWVQNGFTFDPKFMATINSFYPGFDLTYINFSDKYTPSAINDWVKTSTNHQVTSIVNKKDVSKDAMMYLINITYAKLAWKNEFPKNLTKKGTFYLSNGQSAKALYMKTTGNFDYYENDIFQAVKVNLADPDLEAVFFLPKETKTLMNIYRNMNGENYFNWSKQFKKRLLMVEIPKMDLEYKTSFIPEFKEIGVGDPFDQSYADFRKMFKIANFSFVSNEISDSFLKVDEYGLNKTIFDKNVKDVISFDHPFVMVIANKTTNAWLLIASIENPHPDEWFEIF
ncbi:Serine protease inhibitor [Thermodesulfobium acidiphilum]|uniref:Serine protease inhibitor n=1 Tax=Thermodesulfobium acidiphilum TaxID=1794699 RepID=A0A2R4W1C7_THEAF|nr:Serine protease inhibitor [Thermodesulfobium acidiphilum]